jgi:DNA-binding transcriptional MocR family regulator
LPGSRKLAQDLKVNRNTVVEALNVLLNEEWLVSKERRGTFVSDILPVLSKTVKTKHDPVIEKMKKYIQDNLMTDIRIVKLLPLQNWQELTGRFFSRKGRWQMMGYEMNLGMLNSERQLYRWLITSEACRLVSMKYVLHGEVRWRCTSQRIHYLKKETM